MSETEQNPEATPEETPQVAAKAKKRTISPAKWAEIERAWTHGKFPTMKDLSEHFGVPENTLMIRFRDRKLKRGQVVDEYNRRVQEELEQQAKQDAKVLAARIRDTREQHYQMANGIAKMTWAEVLTAKQSGAALSTTKGNLASLESAMKVLKMAREERFAVLGLNDDGAGDEDDALPELVVSELTQEEIDEMRARGMPGAEDDDEDILDTSAIAELKGEDE